MSSFKYEHVDYVLVPMEHVQPGALGGYWEMEAAKKALYELFSRDLPTGGVEFRKLPEGKRIVIGCDGRSMLAEWEDVV